jgi:hypothetical protein
VAILTYSYQWSSSTTEPPTGSQIRGDADILTGIQKLWVRYLTTDGADAFFALMASAAGWTLWLQDKDDHTRGARYVQTGPPIDKGGYVELPVTIDVDNAPLLTQLVILGLVSPVDSSATGPAPPSLITLDALKDHLRITSTADDADLQRKLDQAEAQVFGWCSTTPRAQAVVDTWTETTVPPVVVAAILIQAGELYRFRGDDPDAPPRPSAEGDLAVGVRELLRAYHDAGIA